MVVAAHASGVPARHQHGNRTGHRQRRRGSVDGTAYHLIGLLALTPEPVGPGGARRSPGRGGEPRDEQIEPELEASVGVLEAIGFAFVWLFILLGLVSGSAKGAQGLSFLVFPLSFVSSAYVRVETLPRALQIVAEHQPLTVMIDAVRALTLGPAGAALLDQPTGTLVTRALLWAARILAVSVPLALHRYHRG